MPTPKAIAQAVVMTAVSLIVINIIKPYLPTQVKNLLNA